MSTAGAGPSGAPARLDRRDLLRMGVAAGGALAATPFLARFEPASKGAGAVNSLAVAAKRDDDAGPPPKFPHFSQPFRVPPVLRPSRTQNGVNFYNVEQRPALQQIL